MLIERNAMLVPALSKEVLDRPHRILTFDLIADELWCIELPRIDEHGHRMGYVRGPRLLSARAVTTALKAGNLKQEAFIAPGYWAMTDEAYLTETDDPVERARRQKRIDLRDAAWNVIAPIVSGVPIETLVHTPSLRPRVLECADAAKCSLPTVYRLVHLYLAHGSTLNGLIPAIDKCGGHGKQRCTSTKRIGRQPSAFKRGYQPTPGFIPTEDDKARMATAYGLIGATCTRTDAYNILCAAFYSDPPSAQSKATAPALWPGHLRPTKQQFCYWGALLTEKIQVCAHPKIVADKKIPTHRGGSTQDLAAAIGQCAMFDATSTDVYLVSIYNRSVKLPPMTRSLLIEVRSTACIGFYCGWNPPSQATALQTILCGARDKSQICGRFGIPLAPDEWPGIVCRLNLADNGEMRGAKISDAERMIGFGVEYAKTYFGAGKGDVESRHHADHKGFDHKLPGSTKGKPRQRGVPHAAETACWNYFEYMRELLLYIINYNNTEVSNLAPTQMLVEGIRPTRINILKWMRDHGQRADIVVDLGQLRALTLPECKASMQYNGIILKTADGKRNIPGLRFFSDELRQDDRFIRANTTRKSEPIIVRADAEALDEIWLPSSHSLIRLPNVASDDLLIRQGTLADVVSRMDTESVYRDSHQQEVEQSSMEMTLHQQETTANARREQVKQNKSEAHPPSKHAQRTNMRKHAADEQKAVDAGGIKKATANVSLMLAPKSSSAPTLDNSSSDVMSAFLASLKNLESP